MKRKRKMYLGWTVYEVCNSGSWGCRAWARQSIKRWVPQGLACSTLQGRDHRRRIWVKVGGKDENKAAVWSEQWNYTSKSLIFKMVTPVTDLSRCALVISRDALLHFSIGKPFDFSLLERWTASWLSTPTLPLASLNLRMIGEWASA